MTDKKLTDEEIVKALECCDITCRECPLIDNFDCIRCLCSNALNRLNHIQSENESQKAEIERLTEENILQSQKRANIFEITNAYQRGKAAGYKEFAEKLIAISHPYYNAQIVFELQIKNLLKEMVGEE